MTGVKSNDPNLEGGERREQRQQTTGASSSGDTVPAAGTRPVDAGGLGRGPPGHRAQPQQQERKEGTGVVEAQRRADQGAGLTHLLEEVPGPPQRTPPSQPTAIPPPPTQSPPQASETPARVNSLLTPTLGDASVQGFFFHFLLSFTGASLTLAAANEHKKL